MVYELPAEWPARGDVANGVYVGPLRAAVFLARGAGVEHSAASGAGMIDVYTLVTAGGNIYNFRTTGSLAMWASINAARVIREVELAEGMTPARRAVWLASKRGKLAKMAAQMVNASARVGVFEPARAAALIEEADFALAKWGHYA